MYKPFYFTYTAINETQYDILVLSCHFIESENKLLF